MLILTKLMILLASLFSGYDAYSVLVIVPLGAAALVVFFAARPEALANGWSKGGVSYVADMTARNCVLVGVLFGLGRLLNAAV